MAAAGRVGKGESSRETKTLRWKKWKGEKVKLKWLIREKKRNCWQKYLKDYGTKDPWEVVRLAKNPWGSKTRMRTLKDLEGKVIEAEDRAEALEKAYFLWQDREAEEGEEDRREDAPGLGREELQDKVLEALSRNSNTSAPGPDGISYKIIKWANKSVLGEYLIDDVVDNLMEGKIPKEWQDPKVVFIPKPNRDMELLKA